MWDKMRGQRMGKQSRGETEPGRKVETVRPRRRSGEEQEIEKIPEECWVYGILCLPQSLSPCIWRCRIKAWVVARGGRERRRWIGWHPDS